jgi:hypothetical protein
MRAALLAVESQLPALLRRDGLNGWSSVDVTYELPRVERLWRNVDDVWVPGEGEELQRLTGLRVFLHRIHPCDHPLYHPHPWPSAVRLVDEPYEMDVGYGPSDKPPPTATTLWLRPASIYAMIEPDGWHSVKPLAHPCLSVMVVGRPWERWSPGKGVSHGRLSSEAAQDLLETFRRYY